MRHAESARNAAKGTNRFFLDDEARRPVHGVADHHTPLTERGRAQATTTAIAVRKQFGQFDCAYHSGYRRTEDTLEHLLMAYSARDRARLEVQHHLFLRERDTGYTFDMTTAEAERAFPWLQDYWRTYGAIFGRPPGGESLADVAARVASFLDLLYRTHAGQRVLVVTHGGTLWMFRMLLEQWSWDDAAARMANGRIAQCSVTDYVFDGPARGLVLRQAARTYY